MKTVIKTILKPYLWIFDIQISPNNLPPPGPGPLVGRWHQAHRSDASCWEARNSRPDGNQLENIEKKKVSSVVCMHLSIHQSIYLAS